MRTKLKIMAIAAIFASASAWEITEAQKHEESAIVKANVEALTKPIVTIEYDKCCLADVNYDCVPNYMGPIQGKGVSCE